MVDLAGTLIFHRVMYLISLDTKNQPLLDLMNILDITIGTNTIFILTLFQNPSSKLLVSFLLLLVLGLMHYGLMTAMVEHLIQTLIMVSVVGGIHICLNTPRILELRLLNL